MSFCEGDHCVTCADEGIEMLVVEPRQQGLAVCSDRDGARLDVLTELVGEVDPGDALLVHAGVAIARLR
jgi:hydrogenase expression/formation protein HypC